VSQNKDDKADLKISDLLKKVVSTGLGAAFMTEEAIREKLGDIPLPKDVISGLLQNARTTKDEFMSAVKKEMKNFLGKVNVSEELQKLVEKYDIEVNATLKFHPKKKPENQENKHQNESRKSGPT
jgi:hypothetical protein